ncbi:hypothetical protein [Streptomyces flaveus]|uniref:hypothetical protein n=1 Tax=Streptomyces flaveus TaxID=66370 RepID=UPI00332E90AB
MRLPRLFTATVATAALIAGLTATATGPAAADRDLRKAAPGTSASVRTAGEEGDLMSPAGGIGIAAWTPTVSPLYTNSLPAEHVYRNQTNAQRSSRLNNCPSGRLCIAVGQGDGRHAVFELYYCTERRLGNFIDAGAVNNNQTGNVRAWFASADGRTHEYIAADGVPVGFNPYPYDYLRPCFG